MDSSGPHFMGVRHCWAAFPLGLKNAACSAPLVANGIFISDALGVRTSPYARHMSRRIPARQLHRREALPQLLKMPVIVQNFRLQIASREIGAGGQVLFSFLQ